VGSKSKIVLPTEGILIYFALVISLLVSHDC